MCLRKCPRSLEDFCRARPDTIVLGEVAPAHGAGAVEKKLGRARYVLTIHARSFVQQVVLADDRAVAVRENGEGVAGLAGELRRNFGSVDADCDRTNPQALEFG